MLRGTLSAILIIALSHFACGARAEQPEKPTLEALFQEANVVATGEPVSLSPEIRISPRLCYRLITFRVVDVYKGSPSVMKGVKIDGALQEGRFVNVLIQTASEIDCNQTPQYKVGTKYLIFLGDTVAEYLYSRSKLDRPWRERLADSETQNQLAALQKR